MTYETILDLQDLSKAYGDSIAVDHIDLHVRTGEFLTFLGPSGSGKTTTLNLIAGFIEPTTGSMLLNGAPLEKMRAHERNLGVVFQHYALFPHMTVADNVGYPLKQRKMSKAKRTDAVHKVLQMVRLEKYANRYPKQLSGGQQQRVALARAIVYRPPILLMDEPLGALDKKLREWLQMELRRIHRELGSTFIYVTHDQEEALALSDRVAVFNEGRIEQIGTGKELYDKPSTLFVGKFIGESSVFEGTMAGGRFEANGKEYNGHGTVPDGPAAILVRPEKLTVSEADAPALSGRFTNSVIGEIQDIVFIGSAVKYTLRTPIGEAVAHVPAERSVDSHIGDRVMVTWHPEDAQLLPA
jgi:putative spermidine/putrescine transport system ATP-binding protein